jgi:hypothetical protein
VPVLAAFKIVPPRGLHGRSCGGWWSARAASLSLLLGVQAPDSGVELGSLLLVDPSGWDPFR